MATVHSGISWPVYNPNNGQMCDGTIDELIVCAQSTTTTLSQAYLIPENAIIEFLSFYVSVIPGGTTYVDIGDELEPQRYVSRVSTTAGTSNVLVLGGTRQFM